MQRIRQYLTRISFGLFILTLGLSACSGGAGSPKVTPTTQVTPTEVAPTPTALSQIDENQLRLDMVTGFLSNPPADWGLIDPQTLSQDSGAFILDVRTADEYAGGHIEGSINIPLKELADHLDALPGGGQEIVAVCGIGHRGAIGMTLLQFLGYTNAHSLKGGLSAWKEAGLALVEGAAPALPQGSAPIIDAPRLALVREYLDGVLPSDYGLVDAQKMQATITNPSTFLSPSVVDVGEPVNLSGSEIEKFANIPLEKLAESLEEIPFEQDTSKG